MRMLSLLDATPVRAEADLVLTGAEFHVLQHVAGSNVPHPVDLAGRLREQAPAVRTQGAIDKPCVVFEFASQLAFGVHFPHSRELIVDCCEIPTIGVEEQHVQRFRIRQAGDLLSILQTPHLRHVVAGFRGLQRAAAGGEVLSVRAELKFHHWR
jgi:hypothetical protein